MAYFLQDEPTVITKQCITLKQLYIKDCHLMEGSQNNVLILRLKSKKYTLCFACNYIPEKQCLIVACQEQYSSKEVKTKPNQQTRDKRT